MNGKNILLIIISLNVVGLLISFGCAASDSQTCLSVNTGYISTMFNIDQNTDLTQSGGLGLTGNFTNTVEGVTVGQSGTSAGEAVGIFFDGLRMVAGAFTFLTPFPIVALLNSLGVPLYIVALLAIPVFAIYFISIIEFIRGANFGSK